MFLGISPQDYHNNDSFWSKPKPEIKGSNSPWQSHPCTHVSNPGFISVSPGQGLSLPDLSPWKAEEQGLQLVQAPMEGRAAQTEA